jgi:hypothetical protein
VCPGIASYINIESKQTERRERKIIITGYLQLQNLIEKEEQAERKCFKTIDHRLFKIAF